MADSQFSPLGTVAAPAAWKLPLSLQLELKTGYAHFDGTSAAGSFVPCLRVKSNSGQVVFQSTATTTVAAGASADVSWFQHIAVAASGSGGPLSVLTPTATKTANYTAVAGDLVVVDISLGNVQVTLPSGAADLSVVGVLVLALSYSNSFRCHVVTAGGDTFATGGTSTDLLQLGQTITAQRQAATGEWYLTQNGLPAGQTIVDPLLTLRAGNTGGGSVGIDMRNSGNWDDAIRLPNNHALAAYTAAANAHRTLAKLDSANQAVFSDVNTTGLSFVLDAAGNIVLSGTLPIADPGVSGALWNSAGTVKVSP